MHQFNAKAAKQVYSLAFCKRMLRLEPTVSYSESMRAVCTTGSSTCGALGRCIPVHDKSTQLSGVSHLSQVSFDLLHTMTTASTCLSSLFTHLWTLLTTTSGDNVKQSLVSFHLSVCLSVCLFSLCLLNRLTFGLELFCMHGSQL